MCNGIAIIAVKQNGEIKVYCDPENGSHDKLLSENVPVEYHNSYIKVEYIFPGELRLDCPDAECRKEALITGLVDEIFPNILRISPKTIEIIAKNMPKIKSWPKELMQYAGLQDANLRNANLRNVDLWNANLRNANLQGANLRNANLQGANLLGANLLDANLWNANLLGANLRNANLQGANLLGANLLGANLWNANLQDADLWNANLPEPVGGKFDPAKIKEYREKLGIIINEMI